MTEITDKLRGEIPFPEGGDGVVLRYRNSDLAALQKEFGDEWFLGAGDRLNKWDMGFIKTCITLGAKRDGKIKVIKFDDLDVPMLVIAERVLDGLYMSMFGETFEQHLKRVGEAMARMTDGEDKNRPLVSPENTSLT